MTVVLAYWLILVIKGLKSTFSNCINKGWIIDRSDIYPQLDKSKVEGVTCRQVDGLTGRQVDWLTGRRKDRSTDKPIDISTVDCLTGRQVDKSTVDRMTGKQVVRPTVDKSIGWQVDRVTFDRSWVYRSTCQSSNRRPVDQLFCIDRWLITHFYWLHLKSILIILHTYPIFNEYTKPIYSL